MTPPRSNSSTMRRNSTGTETPLKPTIASRPTWRRSSRCDIDGHYTPRVRIDSSAPTRIDLARGTFDIWPLYLFHERAQTINAALSLRARCSIVARRDRRVVLTSEDTGERIEAVHAADLGFETLPLVARLV